MKQEYFNEIFKMNKSSNGNNVFAAINGRYPYSKVIVNCSFYKNASTTVEGTSIYIKMLSLTIGSSSITNKTKSINVEHRFAIY